MAASEIALRSILITGAGSGIGAETARALAAPGCGLLLHARANRDGCEQVAADCAARGATTEIALGDLSDPAVAPDLVDRAVAAFGGLDVMVANAGFPDPRPFAELDRTALDACHAAMTASFFGLLQAARPHLERSASPRVIAISTLNAHVFRATFPVCPASAAAKAGIEALVHAAAVQLAHAGITVNAVAPGLIETERGLPDFYSQAQLREMIANIPLGRPGRPRDVARAVAFVADPEAGYITNQVIHVNGGIA